MTEEARTPCPADDLVDPGQHQRPGLNGPGAAFGSRLVRVLWISNVCLSKGGGVITDALSLRVRVGWFIRSEIIQLDQGWAVSGPSHGPCV